MDVKDPNVIAETELLQAAASIEAAAKKLAQLKPKRTVVGCDQDYPINKSGYKRFIFYRKPTRILTLRNRSWRLLRILQVLLVLL